MTARPASVGDAGRNEETTQLVQCIDGYIEQFEPEVQTLLRTLRETIRRRAPAAAERISYRMPTFTMNGNLVHFAAYERHIGFYPTPSAIAAFEDELVEVEHAKGSIRFPLDKPLPLELIERIVDFRVAENARRVPRRQREGGMSPRS